MPWIAWTGACVVAVAYLCLIAAAVLNGHRA
jgi:hypothetical protein